MYVDYEGGSDANSGETPRKALKTIGAAIARIQEGDNIILLCNGNFEISPQKEMVALYELAEEASCNGNDWERWCLPRVKIIETAIQNIIRRK